MKKHLLTYAVVKVFGITLFYSIGAMIYGQTNITRFSYDSAHRLTCVSYNQQAAIYYQYDASGNRTNSVAVNQTNPKADYDGNSLYDLWELAYFGCLGVDPNADPDHDGVSNFAESLAWTDPTDPTSSFHILSVSSMTNGITIRWSASSYVVYRAWWTDDLRTWSQTNSVLVAGGVFMDTNAVPARRFYRLSVE